MNTPDARLSIFDTTNPSNPVLISEIPVGLEPVSVNPLNNEEAWIVNEVSDSVSIVSVSRGIVTGRTKVYAAFALSGNRTTLIPAGLAPPLPSAVNITNKPPQGGLIVTATDTNWSHVIQYTMPDNDLVEIDAQSLAVTQYFSGIGTVNLGLAVHPRTGDLFVANTDARNLVRFEPNVRGHAVDNRLTRVRITDGTVTALDLNPGIDYSLLPNPSALATALAQPTTSVFDPSSISNDWSLLERQASQAFRDPFYRSGAVTNISLIAHGTIDGQRRKLLYQPATDSYLTDRTDTGPFTREELMTHILAGDTLTLMGVPTVAGVRMALDRDLDGVLDGEVTPPSLTAVQSDTAVTISWPTNSVGIVLEFTERLAPSIWRTQTSVQSVKADRRMIAVPMTTRNRFYRLRSL